MNIILVGLGKVGKYIIGDLAQQGHEIFVIDTDAKKVNDIINCNDVNGISGSTTDVEILKEAGVNNCDLFISVTDKDEINIMGCLLAKKMKAKKTVARIRNPEYHKQIKFISDEFGIDLVINPEKETAEEIRKILDFPSSLKVSSFADGKADIIEYVVKENSPIIDKSLHQIRKSFKVNILFVAVKRDNVVEIPNGEFKIKQGDVINIIGDREEIASFLSSINDLSNKIRNIMIIGGGKTSYYLAQFLNKGRFNLKIIEKDVERCNFLKNHFSKATIINGDGSNSELLLSQGLKDAGAIVCLTNYDEENFVISLFAHNNGVNKIITKVNHENLSTILEQTNFASIVSPKKVISNKILAYVNALTNPNGNHILGLTKLVSDSITAILFKATESCNLLEKPLKEISFKSHYIIGCVIRGEEVIIPSGQTVIQKDDQIIVITSEENLNDINEIIK